MNDPAADRLLRDIFEAPDVGDGLRSRVEELEAEVERLRIVEVASVGAHALLEDAEERISAALALHHDPHYCGRRAGSYWHPQAYWPCPTVVALGGGA